MRRQHTFVVKILLDDEEPQPIRGLIHEPASADEWSQSFAGSDEFWIALVARLVPKRTVPPKTV
jgi:hypothetical protein